MLIAGFGRFGQIVARLLAAQKMPFIAIEHSAEQVDFVRRFGNPVYYGDPARPELLRSAGAAQVRVFVIAIDGLDDNLRTVRTIRRLYPDAKVFARARDRRHAWALMDLGAEAMRETFFSSLKLGEQVLVELGVPAAVAHDHAQRFREHDERMLKRAVPGPATTRTRCCRSAQDARRELEELFNADPAKACWARSPSAARTAAERRSAVRRGRGQRRARDPGASAEPRWRLSADRAGTAPSTRCRRPAAARTRRRYR